MRRIAVVIFLAWCLIVTGGLIAGLSEAAGTALVCLGIVAMAGVVWTAVARARRRAEGRRTVGETGRGGDFAFLLHLLRRDSAKDER